MGVNVSLHLFCE